MMSDMPTSPYGSLPDGEMKDCCDEMCKGKTVDEISKMADYLSSMASKAREEMSKSLTIDDFHKMAKKSDMVDTESASEDKVEGMEE